MADTIFTRALAEAVAIHDSTQALAYALRVPEGTLLRWIAGRAQMPIAAFHHVIRMLVEHERRLGPQPEPAVHLHPVAMRISIGDLLAQCLQCQGEDFVSADAPARMTSVLSCASCRSTIVHADLLAALATQSAKRGHTARAPARLRAVAALPVFARARKNA